MAGKSTIAQLNVLLNVDSQRFERGLGTAQGQVKGFTKSIGGMSAVSVAAIAAVGTAVGKVTLDLAKLGGKIEPVRKRFDRLAGADLGKLREATGGLITDMELMSRTNFANNLGLDIKALPELFKAAKLTAQETGQSVDYLVDSIVTGIGRKSVKILDNLGISAVELKKELGGVSLEVASIAEVTEAVSNILARKTDDSMLTTVDTESQRIKAAWENIKTSIGGVLNDSKLLSTTLGLVANTLQTSADAISIERQLKVDFNYSDEDIEELFGNLSRSSRKMLKVPILSEALQKEKETASRTAKQLFETFGTNFDAAMKTVQSHAPGRLAIIEEEYKNMVGAAENFMAKIEALGKEQQTERTAAINLRNSLAEINKELRETQEILNNGAFDMSSLDGFVGNLRKGLTSQISEEDQIQQTIDNYGMADEEVSRQDEIDGQKAREAHNANMLAQLNQIRTVTGLVSQGFDTMYSAIENGENVFEALGDMLKDMLVQMIKMAAVSALISAIFPGAGAVLGGGGGIASIAAGLFGGQNTLNLFGGSTEGRAVGGRVQAGVPYKVNEHGAEIFVPEVGGRILTSSRSRMSGGGSGGVDVNIEGMAINVVSKRANAFKSRYGV